MASEENLTFEFGDARLDQRGRSVMRKLLDKNIVNIRKMAENWAEQIGFYRFFDNQKVTSERLSQSFAQHCGQRASGGHYLVIQDTTQPNFEWNRRQISDQNGLGVIGDGASLGFFLHPSLVLRASDESCIGFAHVHHWARTGVRPKDERAAQVYKSQAIEDKESYRWLQSMERAGEVLKDADQITNIQDREGDIFELFHQTQQQERAHLIVRSRDNRNILTSEGKKAKLFEYMSKAPVLGVYSLPVRGDIRKKRVKRVAHIEVRVQKVWVLPPKRLARTHRAVCLWAVEACESPQTVPAGEKPILWRLITSHVADTLEEAVEIIYFYSLRWHIETLFRLLKTDGLNIEACELESGYAIIRMTYLCLFAALRCMCLLLAAKHEDNQQAANDLFEPDEIQCLEKIGHELNGKTTKQSNPYKAHSLQWAFWIIGRLGGWSGLASQHPPGVITLHNGLKRFNDLYDGWRIAHKKDVYIP